MKLALPINKIDIPDFKAWVNWNGFNYNATNEQGHKGFDFAAYLTLNGTIILGLPRNTAIRAVADGTVQRIARGEDLGESDYYSEIRITHKNRGQELTSIYGHVVPLVGNIGGVVKKGDVIGNLYTSKGNDIGYLPHLHLQLTDSDESSGIGLIDPSILGESLNSYTAVPQGKSTFQVNGLENAPVKIANFKEIIGVANK